MRCAEASWRRRVFSHARRRVDDTDLLSRASDGSGSPSSPKGMVIATTRWSTLIRQTPSLPPQRGKVQRCKSGKPRHRSGETTKQIVRYPSLACSAMSALTAMTAFVAMTALPAMTACRRSNPVVHSQHRQPQWRHSPWRFDGRGREADPELRGADRLPAKTAASAKRDQAFLAFSPSKSPPPASKKGRFSLSIPPELIKT